MKIAMVTTHPIQYQVPWLRLLSAEPGINLTVYFAMVPDALEQGREFGVAFSWDVPLLDGYRHVVLRNVAPRPSLTEFSGCDTPDIIDIIRREKFDAVIVNGWGTKTVLQALWGCVRSGTPCIFRGEVNGLTARPWWKRLAHRALLSRYAAILCIGRANRAYCEARGVPAEKLFDTPYCVDNSFFSVRAEALRRDPGREAIRRHFGLDPIAPTFLFCGKLVPKKRPQDLIEAVRVLTQNEIAVQALIVGAGPMSQALTAQAQGLPVRFAGFLNQGDMSRAYAASDALVLPSDAGETWGLVVNEAMACGLSAIVSDRVGCAEDLVDRSTGGVFACGNVAALAGEMQRLAIETTLWETQEAALARVQDYRFDNVVVGCRRALAHVFERARRHR